MEEVQVGGLCRSSSPDDTTDPIVVVITDGGMVVPAEDQPWASSSGYEELDAIEECGIVNVAIHQSAEAKQICVLTPKVQRKEANRSSTSLTGWHTSCAVGETESWTKHP